MDQTLQITEEIRGFLEGLISDSGMVLEPQMKEEMVKELFARLDSYMTSVIVEKLSSEDVETFIKMNEDKKPKAEVEQFIKDKLPNAKEVFTNAFIDFRNLYLGNVAASRESNNLEEKKN
jgi:hypothetical protein